MTGILQLTEQLNPLAQTFRVTESGGSVITSVGLFFEKAPAVSDLQIPVTIELRPVTESGSPSGFRFIPGTRVSATPAQIRAVASTTFSSSTEYKFTFREPVYIPANVEIAICAYTNAKVGQYKIYAGTIGEHVSGSTTKLVTHNLNAGVFFQSSNGTVWSKDQYTDIAFKVYRANFTNTDQTAVMVVDAPPKKRLTENTFTDDITQYPSDPLRFTSGSTKMRVIHPAHGFIVGDKVTLSTDSDGFDSASTISGIKGSSILGTRSIDSADVFGYTLTIDSAADSSIRAGGTGLLATEQYVLDHATVNIPAVMPPNTQLTAQGSFTTHKSFAGSQNAYQTTSGVALPMDQGFSLNDPHVVASTAQEDDPTKLNGNASTTIKVKMTTANKFAAPYLNVNAASLESVAYLIDYQDSDNSVVRNRNTITTIDYTTETQSDGGTTGSKHITIPFTLEDTATSIRVMVDAIRPASTDFTVWYRTAQTASETLIGETPWIAFSKTINPPNKSNYSQIGITEEFRQYEFNVYDISDFDQYQIKITMNSTNSVNVPIFANLRTIATV